MKTSVQHERIAIESLSDREAVLRRQSGDLEAFNEVYFRYSSHVRAWCWRRLSSVCDVDDATQETFTRAWRSIGDLSGELRLKAWLATIARNVCTDILRRQRCQAVGGAAEIERFLPPVALATSGSELSAEVLSAFRCLPQRHREVLFLREALNLSYQDIANIQEVEVGSVQTRIFRARHALREAYFASVLRAAE